MASSKQHPADNHDLIRVQGVVEHKPETIAIADHVVDLGPGAGHDGGRIVFEGTPADLVAARSTLTGEHLAAFVGSRKENANETSL